MRISDWSSDVCSSDLGIFGEAARDRARPLRISRRRRREHRRPRPRRAGGRARLCPAQRDGPPRPYGAVVILPIHGEVAAAKRLTEGGGVIAQPRFRMPAPTTTLRAAPLPVPGSILCPPPPR